MVTSLNKIFSDINSLSKWIPAAGVIALLVLQTQFVTVSKFEKISDRILVMEKVLIRLEQAAVVDKHHERLLSDHEARIRVLENNY